MAVRALSFFTRRCRAVPAPEGSLQWLGDTFLTMSDTPNEAGFLQRFEQASRKRNGFAVGDGLLVQGSLISYSGRGTQSAVSHIRAGGADAVSVLRKRTDGIERRWCEVNKLGVARRQAISMLKPFRRK